MLGPRLKRPGRGTRPGHRHISIKTGSGQLRPGRAARVSNGLDAGRRAKKPERGCVPDVQSSHF